MTKTQEEKLSGIIAKYNPILLNSMRLALTEDLINLIILNKDDETFELSKLLQNQDELANYVTRQFLKQNSAINILAELQKTDEFALNIKRKFAKKQLKLGLK